MTTADAPASKDRTDPRTVFVLGGGGTGGSVQVGMLSALVDAGITPDAVLGCSIGALNGAAFAARPDRARIAALRTAWTEVIGSGRVRLLDRHPWAHRGNAAIGKPDVLRSLIDLLVTADTFEELSIPFACVAAEIERSRERWFDSGPLADPILASAAVPGLFPPVEVDGRHHYDGGLVNSIPLDRAIADGATRVFVLQVGRVEAPLRAPRRTWEAALVAFEIARRHRYASALEAVPDGVEVHVLPSGDSIDFDDRRQWRIADTSAALTRLDTAAEASRHYLEEHVG